MKADWRGPIVLFPASIGVEIDKWGTTWGLLDLRFDDGEAVVTVGGYSKKDTYRLPYSSAWLDGHYLRHADPARGAGVWYRSEADLRDLHRSLLARRLAISPAALEENVSGWRQPHRDGLILVAIFTQRGAGTEWSFWWVSHHEARPAQFDVVEERLTGLDFLRGAWPVGELGGDLVTIVGLGSIGSAAADALASYALRKLALVDPDRLLQHNVVRHRGSDADIGKYKVNAAADLLERTHAPIEVERFPLDVIEDADVMRPLFVRSSIVLCSVDGVAPRRVVNHLARRAGVPAVFAAVLENGAFGEIVRVRSRVGCLLCYRASLEEAGAFDPEPGIDRGYGFGSPHRPMTAVPGDLSIVGELAAKAAVSTLLEAKGRWNQRLPGDVAVVGLQPAPDMPAPFDIARAGEVRWHDLPGRRKDCPTCATH